MGWLFTHGQTRAPVDPKLPYWRRFSIRVRGDRSLYCANAPLGGFRKAEQHFRSHTGEDYRKFKSRFTNPRTLHRPLSIGVEASLRLGLKVIDEGMGPVEIDCPLRLPDLPPEPNGTRLLPIPDDRCEFTATAWARAGWRHLRNRSTRHCGDR
jgi:hypothetical protein